MRFFILACLFNIFFAFGLTLSTAGASIFEYESRLSISLNTSLPIESDSCQVTLTTEPTCTSDEFIVIKANTCLTDVDYVWFAPNGSQLVGLSEDSIRVQIPGQYRVEIRSLTCTATDSIQATRIFCPAVSQPDSLWLVSLYESSNGVNWSRQENWLTGPLASWEGVTMTPDGQHIESLRLSANNLVGSIPSFQGLTQLKTLDLSGNELQGSLPSLDSLVSIESIDLDRNLLTGSIPTVNVLSRLRFLDLSYNQFVGEIPSVSNLVDLEFLVLGNNQLVGVIPDLTSNRELILLSLANNSLQGNVPFWVLNQKLQTLNLAGNELSGEVPPFNLAFLKFLNLSDNELSGPIISVDSLYAIERFDIANNNFAGAVPRLTGLSDLTYFNISENNFSGQMVDLTNNTKLKELNVSVNLLTGNFPNISHLVDLEYFVIHRNIFLGGISAVDSLTKLITFDISFNQISEPLMGFDEIDSVSIRVNNNQLTFEDILIGIFENGHNKTYAPQDTIKLDLTISKQVGESLELSLPFDEAVDSNIYLWRLADSVIAEKTGDGTLLIESLTTDLSGSLNVLVRNSIATQLELVVTGINISVTDPCDTIQTTVLIGDCLEGSAEILIESSVDLSNAEVSWQFPDGSIDSTSGLMLETSIGGSYEVLIKTAECQKNLLFEFSGCPLGFKAVDIEGFQLYPNPAQSSFIIETKKTDFPLDLQLFNTNGQLQHTFQMSRQKQVFDLKVSKGIYWLNIPNLGVTKKIIKL